MENLRSGHLRQCAALFCALFVLGTSRVSADPVWVPLDGQPPGTPPTITVDSSTTDSTVFTVAVHGFWEEEITTGSVTYHKITLPCRDTGTSETAAFDNGNYSGTNEVGRSQLPVVCEMIGMITSPSLVQVTNINRMGQPPLTVPGRRVYPFLEPVSDLESPLFVTDPVHYGETNWYPYNPDSPPSTVDCSFGERHALSVATVPVSCFFVVPATQELRVYPMTQCTVSHAGPVLESYHVSPVWESAYSGTVTNLEFLRPLISFGPRPQQLRIYIGDKFQTNEALTTFTIAKQREGFTVTTRTVGTVPQNDVSNDYQGISNDISTFYAALPCNDIYVLLIGDSADVASGWYAGSKYSGVSDYKYSLIGNDNYPDLFIGRISADSSVQLTRILNKILAYEQTPPENDWLSKVELACYYWSQADRSAWQAEYQTCSEAIRTAGYAVKQPTFKTCYGSNSSGTVATVKNDINTSYGIVNYRGHGTENTWYQWDYNKASLGAMDISALSNGAFTPIVFAVACANGDITWEDCIGETWMEVGDDTTMRGGVAHIGGTMDTFTNANHDFDKALFKRIFDKGIFHISPALNAASSDVIRLWDVPNKTNYGLENAYAYMLLGDPTMLVRTGATASFDEVKSSENPVNGDVTVTVTVKSQGQPVAGATVCIEYSASPLTRMVSTTDVNGQSSFNVSVVSETLLTAIVSKHNYTTWEGAPAEIPVVLSSFGIE